ncbi:MAG: hypothetical protein V3T30_06485 [Thermodesulfobacteriota bacterium]
MKKLHLDTNPLRSKWPIIFAIVTTACVVSYFFFFNAVEPFSKTDAGLIYGAIALEAIIFLVLLRVRKALYKYKIGSLHGWVQSHVYIGIISILLIFFHTGFRFSGFYSGLLFALFSLVVGSGIVGMLIYMIVPASLTKFGREMLNKEEIVKRLDSYLEQADKAATGTSDELQAIYKSKVRPLFTARSTRWSYLLKEERQVLSRAKKHFEGLKSQVPDGSTYDLYILSSIYTDAARLHFKWAKLRALRGWLNLHVPLTAMMVTAALIHVGSVLYY